MLGLDETDQIAQIANRAIVNTDRLHGKFALITLIKAFGMAWRKSLPPNTKQFLHSKTHS
jgi:hypothetical protein